MIIDYKNVLVTGGTGFIGSHLVEKLLSEDKNVVVLTLNKPIDSIEYENLEIIKQKGAKILYGDLRDKQSLYGAVRGNDVVFHLGAISRPMNIPKNVYYDTNCNGTKNILDVSKECGIKRFIHVSTVSVLGTSPDGHPLKENEVQVEDSDYGLSKRFGEDMAMEFYEKHNFPVVILRPCLMYGPRCTVRLVIFKFVQNRLFPLFNSGKAKMEFCYVDNLIQSLMLAAENDTIIGEIFNITDGESYEIRRILSAIAVALDVSPPFIKLPLVLGKILGYCSEISSKIIGIYPPFSSNTVNWMSRDMNVYDCSKAKDLLGYDPKINLEEGIIRTVRWFREKGYL